MEGKKVALVLSGGGQGAWIQLGVLQVLEEEKVPFDMVVGTSAGGLIGWALASGLSTSEIIKKSKTLKEKDFRRVSFDNYSIFDPRVAFNKFKESIGNKNIEELPKKFAVVAVDLFTGDEVVLDKGSALTAVRATTCIPAIFPPVEHEGRLLVDGSILNVLPVDVAYQMGADVTIAIDVSNFGKSMFSLRRRGLNPITRRLLETAKNPYISIILKRSYLFESLIESTRIMGNKIRNEKLARYPPTVMIEEYFTHNFASGMDLSFTGNKKVRDAFIKLGKQAALRSMDKIREALAVPKTAQ